MSIPLWAVTLIGGLFVTVLSFIMIMSVYGRFFRLYLYTAIAPVPCLPLLGADTERGKELFKILCGGVPGGAIIVLACIIFSVLRHPRQWLIRRQRQLQWCGVI